MKIDKKRMIFQVIQINPVLLQFVSALNVDLIVLIFEREILTIVVLVNKWDRMYYRRYLE